MVGATKHTQLDGYEQKMFFDKLKNFPKHIKVAYNISNASYLLSRKRHKEAFVALQKVESICAHKFFEYHLILAQAIFLSDDRTKDVAKELENAFDLIAEEKNSLKKYSKDEKNYLTSWILFMLGHCYTELKYSGKANYYIAKSENYKFKIESISESIKNDFPMRWDSSYQKYEKETSS